MPVPVTTAFYAGILGRMAIVLGFLPGSIRGRTKISIGAGGSTRVLLVASGWSIVLFL